MTGGEHQVHDGQHGVEPVRQFGGIRYPVRDPGRRDLLLRPGDPGGHGRLGHQERPRNIAGGQTAHQPQRQRDLSLPGQRRMAAGEDQPQPVIGDPAVIARLADIDLASPWLVDLVGNEQRQFRPQGPIPAKAVEGPVPGRCRQPRRWVTRHALLGPGIERGHVGVLHAFLGHVQITGDPGGRREDESPLAPVCLGDGGADRVAIARRRRRAVCGQRRPVTYPRCP